MKSKFPRPSRVPRLGMLAAACALVATEAFAQPPVAVQWVGRVAGVVPADVEGLPLVPGHQEAHPGQALRPPGGIAPHGQVGKKEAGRQVRMASASC